MHSLEPISLLIIFQCHTQQGGDCLVVVDAKREATTMFSFVPKTSYVSFYHMPTYSVASTRDPSSRPRALAGDGRSAGERSDARGNMTSFLINKNGERPGEIARFSP